MEKAEVIMANADPLPKNLCVAPWRAMELVSAFCLSPMLDRGESDPVADDIYLEAQGLLADLDKILTPANRQAILLWIKRIEANRDVYKESLLLWLDVIEEVAFEIELDLKDNTGPVKLRRVKAAVFYLMEQMTHGAEVPGIPRYLNRFALHIAIRGTVEFIVTLNNPEKYQSANDESPADERQLWGKERGFRSQLYQGPRPSASFIERPLDRIHDQVHNSRVFVAFLKWWEPKVERLIDWVLDKLMSPPLVSPIFKKKVDDLILRLQKEMDGKTGSPAPISDMFSNIFEVVRWIGQHGTELRAAIDVFSRAFHLTSELGSLDPERRIEVVKGTLILYFEERGLSGPYFRFMLQIIVDIGLDALSFLYKKQQDRAVQLQN